MTTTTPTTYDTTAHADVVSTRRPVWRAGAVAGLVAAVATMIVVAVARAGDVPLTVDGEEIPILAFAELTFVGAAIGIGLAKLLGRWARRPRRTFTVVTDRPHRAVARARPGGRRHGRQQARAGADPRRRRRHHHPGDRVPPRRLTAADDALGHPGSVSPHVSPGDLCCDTERGVGSAAVRWGSLVRVLLSIAMSQIATKPVRRRHDRLARPPTGPASLVHLFHGQARSTSRRSQVGHGREVDPAALDHGTYGSVSAARSAVRHASAHTALSSSGSQIARSSADSIPGWHTTKRTPSSSCSSQRTKWAVRASGRRARPTTGRTASRTRGAVRHPDR